LGTPSGEVGLDLIVGEALAGAHRGPGELDLAVQELTVQLTLAAAGLPTSWLGYWGICVMKRQHTLKKLAELKPLLVERFGVTVWHCSDRRPAMRRARIATWISWLDSMGRPIPRNISVCSFFSKTRSVARSTW
jgi:hypothetical protein